MAIYFRPTKRKMLPKAIKIYAIQECIDGLMECPKVFLNEKAADKYFTKLVNKVHKKDFKDVWEAVEFIESLECYSTEIKYWTTESEIERT